MSDKDKTKKDEPVPGELIRRTTTTITEEYVAPIDGDDLDDAGEPEEADDEGAARPTPRRRR